VHCWVFTCVHAFMVSPI